MAGFQTSVATQPSPGIEGGFYGHNPHYTLTNPDEGMFVAGAVGPYVGRFAFADMATGRVTSAHPGTASVRVGFVHRDQPVVIAGLLTTDSNQVIAGQGVDLMADGPVWARFAGGAAIDQKVFASYADGSCVAGTAGSPPSGDTVDADTTSGSPNLANVSAALYPGQPISGTGIAAGAYVVSYDADAGTAVMSANASATGSGVTITPKSAKETDFIVRSIAGNGELAKISVRG